MANYRSYRQIPGARIPDGSVTKAKLVAGVGPTLCVKWIHGAPNSVCSNGCCCNWQVPTGVEKITWEAWGSGGNGHGACSCNRCQHYRGASGGAYNTKTISTAGGCSYTVCAGAPYTCCSRECNGCSGCASYANGYNLSNFCAIGGARGCANGNWSVVCTSDNYCCLAPGNNGGDFTMTGHQRGWSGHWDCHCAGNVTYACSSGAPFLAVGNEYHVVRCWIRCGCYTVPYASGGQGAMSSYCGSSCCGQGGQGGTGLVKITYL